MSVAVAPARQRTVDGVLRVLAATLGGLLVAFSVAPYFVWPLHWIAFVPLFWALRPDTPRQNVALLLLCGTVSETVIYRWVIDTITLFSNVPWIGALAVLALGAAFSGLPWLLTFVAVHPLRRRLGDLWILALPAWLVVVDWLATRAILFPWQHGVTQYRTPWIFQVVSLGGVGVMSFLLAFFNSALGEAVHRRREGRPPPWRWIAAAVATVAVATGWGAWRQASVEAELAAAPVLRVFQVQTSTDMTWRMSHPSKEALAFWVHATEGLKPGEADLVVWPEGAVPPDLDAAPIPVAGGRLAPDLGAVATLARLWELARDGGFDMVVGSGAREVEPGDDGEPRLRVYNSTYFLDRRRLEVPADAPGPDAVWADLVAKGCDPDAVHVVTGAEAEALAAAGRAAGGDAACLARLDARAAELLAGSEAPATFRRQLAVAPGAFAALRQATASFDAPLRERSFGARRGSGWWTLEDAHCPDGDCAFVVVQCVEGGRCDVFPSAPHYDKLVPLPFGEYIPFADRFPWLADLIEGPGNFRAGSEPVVFEGGDLRLATPICYEGILGYVCERFADPDLLVNVTNDAWYGDTAESDLHGMLVAVRAVELGVPVFRSTWSGTSFLVEPHGSIVAKTPLFTEVKRVVPVRLGKVDTLYRHVGDVFVLACAALVLALLVRARRRGAPA
jgi:apolipoprotein N-acyltransferase